MKIMKAVAIFPPRDEVKVFFKVQFFFFLLFINSHCVFGNRQGYITVWLLTK